MSNEGSEKTKKGDEEETNETRNGDDQQQQDEPQVGHKESPAKSIPLNAKWTMWFDNPRLAPAGSE